MQPSKFLQSIHYHLAHEADLLAWGQVFGKVLFKQSQGMLIFLQGQLGAGKTTLARGFLRGMGCADKVKSPTYTLVEPYAIASRPVFHFDLYRLASADELTAVGLDDYFTETAICLIEWPENGRPFLPAPDFICELTMSEVGRQLVLHVCSLAGLALMERVSEEAPLLFLPKSR